MAPGNAGPVEIEAALSWTDAATAAPGSYTEIARLEPASDEAADGGAADAETIAQVVRQRGARAREQARKMNRAGDYEKAQAIIKAEAAELRQMGAEAAEEADGLEEIAQEFAGPMGAALSKSMHLSSYSARHSRPRPGA